jgi:hypothetical protein
MRPTHVKEINPVLGALNIRRVPMRIMLQDQLLEPEKGSLVRDLLSHLHTRLPRQLSCDSRALVALLSGYNILYNENLLENGRCIDFLLDSELDFYSSRMRFGPDKSGINKTHLVVKKIL